MATLTFNGTSYTVDHAVKGTDYVHGYDAAGVMVVCIGGVVNFNAITYDGSYMTPESCTEDPCNDVICSDGVLKTKDGRTAVKAASGTDYSVARIRNIYAGTSDMTAGSSALASGNIYLVYE